MSTNVPPSLRPVHHRASLLAALCLATSAHLVDAQGTATTRDQLVVTTDWLTSHLHDPDLILLQVGDTGEFAKAHIPGARPVSLAGISAGMDEHMDMDHKLMLEMLPADVLDSRLADLGISDKSHVVVYFATDWVSPTTRVLYTLAYAGLGQSSALLDGGLPAWRSAGQPVETGSVTPPNRGTITAHAQPALVVDAAWVQAHAGRPGFALLDARRSGFYDGSQPDDGPRRGHIPGAQSLPFEELYDAQSHLRSPEELEARFRRAGVQPRDTVVAYCHIGQRATAVLLAAETLGHPVRLYDGSFQEWGRRTDLPVENPAAGGKQ